MKIAVIGSSNMGSLVKNSTISQDQLTALINELGTYIASLAAELLIVPGEGIPLHLARSYKEAGGHQITGIVPLRDKKFGIEHIQEFLSLLDLKIDAASWYEADGEIASFGDASICIGLSPASLVQICMMSYHAQFSGKRVPLIIFENTISEKLPKEIETQLYNVTYVKRMGQLQAFIKKKFFT